jgi:7,8-dihydropterin-6-yl-methyl-4-(beta-D-ribofuranosyl)aminobenzene 5'-phosphate synthase
MRLDIGQMDSLRITVLVEDSVSHNTNLMAVHGVSYLVEASREGRIFRTLVDVGSNPAVLFHNMDALGVAPGCIDAIVLTHCHWDHTRGLSEVVKKIGKENLPVVAHPAIYRSVFSITPRLRYTGVDHADFPGPVAENGGVLLLTKDPVRLADGLATTGEIDRITDYEGSGGGIRSDDGLIAEDNMPDDISLLANVKDRGLVVITGCSHAGIVNIVRQARRITGVTRLSAVIGGLHLVNADSAKIDKTVDGLAQTGVELVSAGHCTGFEAQCALRRALGQRFEPMQCGSRYEFGPAVISESGK